MTNYTAASAVTKPRYRTIKECHEELLKLDKDCKISVYLIRTLCRENKVVYIANGTKSIVNYDSLLSYLGISDAPTQTETQGKHHDKATKQPCKEFGLICCDTLKIL